MFRNIAKYLLLTTIAFAGLLVIHEDSASGMAAGSAGRYSKMKAKQSGASKHGKMFDSDDDDEDDDKKPRTKEQIEKDKQFKKLRKMAKAHAIKEDAAIKEKGLTGLKASRFKLPPEGEYLALAKKLGRVSILTLMENLQRTHMKREEKRMRCVRRALNAADLESIDWEIQSCPIRYKIGFKKKHFEMINPYRNFLKVQDKALHTKSLESFDKILMSLKKLKDVGSYFKRHSSMKDELLEHEKALGRESQSQVLALVKKASAVINADDQEKHSGDQDAIPVIEVNEEFEKIIDNVLLADNLQSFKKEISALNNLEARNYIEKAGFYDKLLNHKEFLKRQASMTDEERQALEEEAKKEERSKGDVSPNMSNDMESASSGEDENTQVTTSETAGNPEIDKTVDDALHTEDIKSFNKAIASLRNPETQAYLKETGKLKNLLAHKASLKKTKPSQDDGEKEISAADSGE
ncbi:MAG: hypothetical protein K2X98_03195 [Alphaproteobacteria bacterium]|nr:hypothetical protein [Alphaproteobacteria bacterium]